MNKSIIKKIEFANLDSCYQIFFWDDIKEIEQKKCLLIGINSIYDESDKIIVKKLISNLMDAYDIYLLISGNYKTEKYNFSKSSADMVEKTINSLSIINDCDFKQLTDNMSKFLEKKKELGEIVNIIYISNGDIDGQEFNSDGNNVGYLKYYGVCEQLHIINCNSENGEKLIEIMYDTKSEKNSKYLKFIKKGYYYFEREENQNNLNAKKNKKLVRIINTLKKKIRYAKIANRYVSLLKNKSGYYYGYFIENEKNDFNNKISMNIDGINYTCDIVNSSTDINDDIVYGDKVYEISRFDLYYYIYLYYLNVIESIKSYFSNYDFYNFELDHKEIQEIKLEFQNRIHIKNKLHQIIRTNLENQVFIKILNFINRSLANLSTKFQALIIHYRQFEGKNINQCAEIIFGCDYYREHRRLESFKNLAILWKDLTNNKENTVIHLNSLYSTILKNNLTCIIQNKDPVELLMDGDCLCVPIEFNDNNNSITKVLDEYVSASQMFNKQEIFVGENNSQKITKCVPIYLFNEHWVVANEWYGLLYSEDYQIKMPFLLLDHLLRNEDKFNDELIMFVENTCQVIFENYSINGVSLDNIIRKRVNIMINLPTKRFDIDDGYNITSNRVFIMHVYMCHKIGNLHRFNNDDFIKFMRILSEDECRKSIKNKNENKITMHHISILLENLFTDDLKKFTTERRDKLSKCSFGELKEELEQTFSAEIKMKDSIIKIIPDDINSVEIKKDFKIDTFSRTAKMFCLNIVKEYTENNLDNLVLVSKLCTSDTKVTCSLRELGLETNEQILWFFLQLYFNNRNYDYINLVKNNYIDPFNKKYVIQFNNVIANIIFDSYKYNNVWSMYEVDTKEAEERADIFAKTENEKEAALMLYKTSLGKNIKHFKDAILNNNAPLIEKKIKMLVSGLYKNVRLFTDSHLDDKERKGWDIGKSNINNIVKKYNLSANIFE